MLNETPCFCSWSGGKDSCLSLHRAIRQGAAPQLLFTMMNESGLRSRSHGLPPDVLQAQADAMGIPLLTRRASWGDYESIFIEALKEIEGRGIQAGIFGDIDIEDHKRWVERICGHTAIRPCHPIWKGDRRELLKEFLELGFKAHIVSVSAKRLDESFLGRAINEPLIEEFVKLKIDPCGEEGEYHTVVTDGPLFSRPVMLRFGLAQANAGYIFSEAILVRKELGSCL